MEIAARARGCHIRQADALRLLTRHLFGFVFVQVFRGKLRRLVGVPFAINLGANLIFTPIEFGLRNLPLASVDILIVWTTIIWSAVAIWPYYRWVAVAQVLYFVWVSLATVLQLSITAMNW